MTEAETRTAPEPTIRSELADCLRVRSLRWLIIVTAAIGVLLAAVSTLQPPEMRQFTAYSLPTQLTMSVTVPFIGVVMVHRALRRPGGRLAPSVAAAMIVAVAAAGFGLAACGVAYGLTGDTTDGFRDVPVELAAPFLTQALAQAVGVGMGLLIRRPVIASLATVVPPLGLYLLLSTTDALIEIRQWTTPLAVSSELLAGTVSPLTWLSWATVVLLWGVTLNVAGLSRR